MTSPRLLGILVCAWACLMWAGPALGQARRPGPLDAVHIDQRIGTTLPLAAPFTDESGRSIRLGDLFQDRPVLLVPAYYECPMLCGLVLNGVVSALRALPFQVGEEFTVVAFSINPTESSAQAREKKQEIVDKYHRPDSASGWHFLTGPPESIRQLTTAIGYGYERDDATGEFAHAAAIMVVTATGRVSHYFYGVEFPPRDLRLALVEASDEQLGSPVDQLLLYCFQYDPTTGRYSRITLQALRTGGTLTVLALGAFVVLMLRRERAGARRPLRRVRTDP